MDTARSFVRVRLSERDPIREAPRLRPLSVSPRKKPAHK
jgi:hypothetical protein